ncbi:PAS domain S-box protein [Roseimarinus sediminis]|uniref:PAS domain S-box protein n=1 Tax=Roseimarinus sediminis TaxID=1610899 RepID=UPI003D21A0C6
MKDNTNQHKRGTRKSKPNTKVEFESVLHTQQQLQKLNEHYQFILEATGTGTWEWNVQTGETIFNEQWANIVGYTLDELQPVSIETWTRLTHPDDLPAAQDALQKHFAGLTPYYETEFRMKHRAGHWIWILDKGKVAEWTPDGKARWMLGTHQDINERKMAAHAANERMKELNAFYKLSELTEDQNLSVDELYSQFANILPQSLQHNHLAYSKLTINKRTYTSDNSTQSSKWKIESPIVINEVEVGNVELGYTTKTPNEYEGPFLKEERLLIDGISERLARITERIQSKEFIIESEKRFRNLVNQMQLGLAVHEIILDKNGAPVDYRFLDCNPAFEKLTGLIRENIVGKTVLEVLPKTEKIWIDKYGQVALTGQPISFESYAREFDKYYNVTAYQPQAMQFVVITEDITVHKQTLLNLQKNNEKFQLLSKAASEMLALENTNDIYNYISDSLHNQYPNAVILFQKVDEETKKSKLINFKGVNSSLINKAIQLTGFDFTKIEFSLINEHLRLFKTGNLCEFKKGLADFSGSQFPVTAAKSIEKILGIKQIYTIGINKDEKLFATIHLMNKGAAITDKEFIELFVKQAGIIIDRIQTAKQLAEREEKYRLITENASDVIWVINVTTQQFTYISPTIELLRGYTPQEAMAQTLEESVTPESFAHIQNALQQNLQKFLSNKLDIEYYIDEIQQPCKDGSIIWVEVSTKFRINKQGEIEVVGVSRKIDERKKMEAAIRENEEKFRLLFKNSPLGIYIANTQGQIEDANPALLSILGSPSLELTKQINVLQLPALVENGYAKQFKECVNQNKIISLELPYTTHWGKKVHLSSYLVPLSNPMGKVEKVYTLMEDITERKRNEEELIKLSMAAEQNPTNIVITNLRGNIEYVNPKFTEITGYSFEEAIGQNPRILKSGYTSPEEYKKLWRTIARGNEWEGIFHNRRKDGTMYWEKARISPIKSAKGKIINYLAIKEDITEQVKARDALIESETKLKEALLTKDKFFSIISHDLRSPFSTLINFTELIADEHRAFTIDEYRQYAKAINQTAQTTYNLLVNLLEWSRLQQGTIKFQPENIMLGPFMEKLREVAQESVHQKNLNFSMHYPHEQLLTADRNMLNAILRNLLSNAVKFTPEGGNIIVDISIAGSENIQFKVKDNGIGMDAHLLEKLFKIDEKVNRPGTNNEPSSGLGLLLCKEFVEKHGGEIWAESNTDGLSRQQGSAFYFTIPIK